MLYTCEACGGLLDVKHDFASLATPITRDLFNARLGAFAAPYSSGVWRFKELVYPDIDPIVPS